MLPALRACACQRSPTIDRSEITDKGSINQRAVLSHRPRRCRHCMTTPWRAYSNRPRTPPIPSTPPRPDPTTTPYNGLFNAFQDIWILDGVRTPMVDYCGALGHISPTDLGIKAARAVLQRSGGQAAKLNRCSPATWPRRLRPVFLPRHIGLYAGAAGRARTDGATHLRHRLRAVSPGGRANPERGRQTALLVGTENMTRNPIAAFEHRTGFKLGADVGFKDYMWEALKTRPPVST